jgi:hypothetical protein
MLARDVGIRGEPLAGLRKIRDWSLNPQRTMHAVHIRPVLLVRQCDDRNPQCGMFFGAGAIPRGIDLCHESMNPNGLRGELMPALIIMRLLLAGLTGNEKLLPPTDMEISCDHAPAERQSCLFAIVSTLERLFLGLHPFWGTEDAGLHFTALKSKPAYLLRNLPFLMYGHHRVSASPQNGYFSHNAQTITLNFEGRFTLDGEIYEARPPLTIETTGPARFLKL